MKPEDFFSPDRAQPLWRTPDAPACELAPLAPLAGIRHLPCLDSGVFFAGLNDGRVGAFSLTSGEPLWINDSLAKPKYQSDVHPVLVGDMLYVSSGDVLHALDKTSGSAINATDCGRFLDFNLCLIVDDLLLSPAVAPDWTAAVSFFRLGESKPYQTGALRSAPVSSAANREILAVAQSKGMLSVFSLPSGRLQWEWDASVFHTYPDPVERNIALPSKILSSLFLVGDLVLLGVSGSRLVALDQRTGAVRWNIPVPILNPSSLAVDRAGQFLVADSEHLCLGDFGSGTLLHSFAIPGNHLQFPTRISATGNIAWCNDVSSGTLFGFSLETGQMLCQRSIGAPVPQTHAPLLSTSGLLMILDANGTLHRFGEPMAPR